MYGPWGGAPGEAEADQERIQANLQAGRAGSGGPAYWPVTTAEAEGIRARAFHDDDTAELARLTGKTPKAIEKLTTFRSPTVALVDDVSWMLASCGTSARRLSSRATPSCEYV